MNMRLELKKIWRWAGSLILLGWVLFFVYSCKGEITTGPTQPTAKVEKTTAPTAVEEEGEKEKKVGWSYNPSGKRDPFQMPELISEGKRSEGELVQYNLDQMWIDGIIVGGMRGDIAHIVLPNGNDYFVKVGDELGINHGRVKEIKPDGIVIEEQYLDPANPQQIRIVEKFLKMETY